MNESRLAHLLYERFVLEMIGHPSPTLERMIKDIVKKCVKEVDIE